MSYSQDMKALSVRQPWAFEINDGVKNLEFRTWKTDYRGPLLICTSSYDPGLWLDVDIEGDIHTLPLPLGCMLCVVNLVDIRPATKKEVEDGGGEWSKGLYAWVLEGGYNVEPEPVKGRLHLFDVPDEEIIEMPEGDYWFHYNYKGRDKPLPKRWA